MSLFTDGLEFIGTNVAKGALSWVGGDIAGWVLGDISGTNGPSNQDVLDAVDKLGQQLTGIEATLASLEDEINTNFDEIQQELIKINQEALYIAWQAVNNQIVVYMNQINTQYSTFVEYAAAAKSTSQQEVQALVQQIQDTNTGAKVSLNGINAFVLGGGQQKSVLELWREMVAPLVGKNIMTFGDAAEALTNYYSSIVYAQMRAINLIVESYNQQNNNAVSQQEYTAYRALMTRQELPFMQALEELTCDAMQQGGCWLQSQINTSLATAEYVDVAQAMWAGGGYVAHYQPTLWRYQAEQLAAAAQAMQAGDRRIVVCMIFDNYATSNYVPYQDYTQLAIQIVQPASRATESSTARRRHHRRHLGAPPPVSPDSTVTVMSEAQYQLPQFSPTGSTKRLIRRNVFTKAISSDGFYQLVDLNDQYPTIVGSHQSSVYFMNPDKYLSYFMYVDGTHPFDYMDFGIYVDPNNWLADNPFAVGG
jgi:hypothetical protein